MYVVTGAIGHTGNIVAKALLTHGERVRVIGRNAERLKPLVEAGAEPFAREPRFPGLPKQCDCRDCGSRSERRRNARGHSEQHRRGQTRQNRPSRGIALS